MCNHLILRLFVSYVSNCQLPWLRFNKKTELPAPDALQETMSSPRTVSWQLLGLQPCSSSPTRTRKSIHLWGSEWRLEGNKSNLASLTRAYFFMHIYSVIVIIMSTKVKVEALVLNTWCFIKRPFLLQSQRKWGLLCVCVFSCFCAFFTFHFPEA